MTTATPRESPGSTLGVDDGGADLVGAAGWNVFTDGHKDHVRRWVEASGGVRIPATLGAGAAGLSAAGQGATDAVVRRAVVENVHDRGRLGDSGHRHR